MAGVLLAIGVLAIENASGGLLITIGRSPPDPNAFLNLFSRGINICAIIVWPAVGLAVRRGIPYGLGLALALFALLLTFHSGAALGAMVLGGIVFGLVFLAPVQTGKALSVAAVFAILAAPFAVLSLPAPRTVFETTGIPNSSYHRLLIWTFTSEHILSRPVSGWGFNTSRVMPGGKDKLDGETALPLHPHNGALQLWLELGAIGAFLGAALAAAASEAVRRYSKDRLSQAAGSACLAAALFVFLLSYGAWQSWWMAALFIAAACVAATRDTGTRNDPSRADPRDNGD